MANYLVNGENYDFATPNTSDISNYHVDSALSSTSENPVKNSVITSAIESLQTLTGQSPFVIQATLQVDGQGNITGITNPDKTVMQVAEAVGQGRPVFLLASGTQGNYQRYIFVLLDEAMVTTSASTISFYFTFSDGSRDLRFRYRDGTITLLNTYDFALKTITTGSFSASSNVSAVSKFKKQNNVYTINISATGNFASGTSSIGTFGGVGMQFDADGIVGSCAISTAGTVYDAVGTYVLAEDGSLTVRYNGTFKKVALSLSYIL